MYMTLLTVGLLLLLPVAIILLAWGFIRYQLTRDDTAEPPKKNKP